MLVVFEQLKKFGRNSILFYSEILISFKYVGPRKESIKMFLKFVQFTFSLCSIDFGKKRWVTYQKTKKSDTKVGYLSLFLHPFHRQPMLSLTIFFSSIC